MNNYRSFIVILDKEPNSRKELQEMIPDASEKAIEIIYKNILEYDLIGDVVRNKKDLLSLLKIEGEQHKIDYDTPYSPYYDKAYHFVELWVKPEETFCAFIATYTDEDDRKVSDYLRFCDLGFWKNIRTIVVDCW